jgi:hypothetical protein
MCAINSAASGMTQACSQLNAVASATANGSADPSQTSLGVAQAANAFKADAAVFRTANQMMGALLDMKI